MLIMRAVGMHRDFVVKIFIILLSIERQLKCFHCRCSYGRNYYMSQLIGNTTAMLCFSGMFTM